MNPKLHAKIKYFVLGIITILCVVVIGLWYQQEFIFSSKNLSASVFDSIRGRNITTLTTDQKIGQLFILGFDGTDKDSFESFIKKYPVGGILLLEKNIRDTTQIKTLTGSLQQLSQNYTNTSLFISIDQEGGSVSRIPFIEEPNTAQPDITDTQQAYTTAYTRGKKLYDLGINLNFSPVLDVTNNPRSFMWDRSFHGSISNISLLGIAFTHGYTDSGIIACPKHFPGHGESTSDPHITPSTNTQPVNQITQQAQPFADVIGAGASCIMAGHAIEENADNLPASESPTILQNWLRDAFRFTGIVITDDMEMDAARPTTTKNLTKTQSITQASLAALQAGADIILISGYSTTQQEREEIYKEISIAIRSGALTQEQIDEKVSRILRVKNKMR